MKYKKGTILRIKKGQDTLDNLEDAGIGLPTSNDLLGTQCEILSYSFDDAIDKHGYQTMTDVCGCWWIPEDCLEMIKPKKIINWRKHLGGDKSAK